MGLSRNTFYRYKAAVEDSGIAGLLERARRKQVTDSDLNDYVVTERSDDEPPLEQSLPKRMSTT